MCSGVFINPLRAEGIFKGFTQNLTNLKNKGLFKRKSKVGHISWYHLIEESPSNVLLFMLNIKLGLVYNELNQVSLIGRLPKCAAQIILHILFKKKNYYSSI